MKKLFMYIIAIVILVNSALVINAAEAETLNSKSVNFNNYSDTVNKNTQDIEFSDTSKASVNNAVYQGTSGKSIKMTSGATGTIYLFNKSGGYTEKDTDTSIRCLTDAVEFSYYIYFSEFDENGSGNIWIDDFTSNTANPASFRITKAGNVVLGTTGAGMKLDPKVWYKITKIIDLKHDVICYFVNDRNIYTRTGVETTSAVKTAFQIPSSSGYTGNVYLDTINVYKKDAYTMTIAEPENMSFDSVDSMYTSIDFNVNGYPHASAFLLMGSENGTDYSTIGTASEEYGAKIDKADIPPFIKVNAYTSTGIKVGESNVIETNSLRNTERTNIIASIDTWSDTNYGDVYFNDCKKVASGNDYNIQFNAPLGEKRTFVAIKGSYIFDDFNSTKTILAPTAITSGNEAVSDLNSPVITTEGTIAFSNNPGKKYADLKTGEYYDIMNLIDIAGKKSLLFVNGSYRGSADITEADITAITGMSSYCDESEDGSVMYMDNVSVSTLVFGEYEMTPVEYYIDGSAVDVIADGALTGKIEMTNDGGARPMAVFGAVYEGDKLVSCKIYNPNLTVGTFKSTVDLDFGTVTSANTVKTIIVNDISTLKPLVLPAVLENK